MNGSETTRQVSAEVEIMSDVWSKWFELAKTNDVGRIGRALDVIVPSGSSRDAAGIERSCSAIHRSHGLVRLARDWENPTFGRDGAESAEHRGRQWRLVVAYAGWESFVRGVTGADLVRPKHHAFVSGTLATGVPAPPRRAELARWILRATPDETTIEDYFGLTDDRYWQQVSDWLVDAKPVVDADAAIALATALRHATVHGMLSATKAHEWGMLAGFDALTAHVVGAVEGTLSRAVG